MKLYPTNVASNICQALTNGNAVGGVPKISWAFPGAALEGDEGHDAAAGAGAGAGGAAVAGMAGVRAAAEAAAAGAAGSRARAGAVGVHAGARARAAGAGVVASGSGVRKVDGRKTRGGQIGDPRTGKGPRKGAKAGPDAASPFQLSCQLLQLW